MPADPPVIRRLAYDQKDTEPPLEFFITRPDGTPVPLIPADELPSSVRLRNVPRSMLPAQAYKLKCVGTAAPSGLVFELERPSSKKTKRSGSKPSSDEAPASSVRGRQADGRVNTRQSKKKDADRSSSGSNPSSRSDSRQIDPQSWKKSGPSGATSSVRGRRDDATVSNPSVTKDADTPQTQARASSRDKYQWSRKVRMPPSGVIPDPQKKKYCTFWIQHGCCGFEQQGCRYMHIMPDSAKLAEIGFTVTPRWWLEREEELKTNARQASAQSHPMNKKTWRKEEPATLVSHKPEGRVAERQGTIGAKEADRPAHKRAFKYSSGTRLGFDERAKLRKTKVGVALQTPSPNHKIAMSRRSSDCSDLIDLSPRANRASTLTSISPRADCSYESDRADQDSERTPTPPRRYESTIFVPKGESIETNVSEARRYAAWKTRKGAVPEQAGNASPAGLTDTKLDIAAPRFQGRILPA